MFLLKLHFKLLYFKEVDFEKAIVNVAIAIDYPNFLFNFSAYFFGKNDFFVEFSVHLLFFKPLY